MQTIEQKVIQTVASMLKVPEDSVKLDSNIIKDLGADSLETVELIMELESVFDVQISDDDASAIETIQDAASLIEKLLG